MTDLRPLLIVEDDELTRAFLLDNLVADGFRVAGAASVAEGLRAIEVRQPALIVLDLVLEGASGLGLLDQVRAADGLASRLHPGLPVLVLSGRTGDADRVRSFARGADDPLNKPSCYRCGDKDERPLLRQPHAEPVQVVEARQEAIVRCRSVWDLLEERPRQSCGAEKTLSRSSPESSSMLGARS